MKEDCMERMEAELSGSVDAIISDPPFNASALSDGELAISGIKDGHTDVKRDFGWWDKSWSPFWLMEKGARLVPPGGWMILKSGDVTFGMNREFGERSAATLSKYLDFFHQTGIISGEEKYAAEDRLPDITRLWEYHCTIAWHKTNPVTRYRLSGPQSAMEWIQVLKRLDNNGNSVGGTFNMPRQNVEGHNFIEGPICMAPERLYWHKIEGEIIPCPDKPTCSHCKDKQERLNHPTQTPLYVWEWILQRFTKPGMRVYDPYAGLRTLEMANRRGGFGLEIISSEINPDYVRVGEMWQDGTWLVPQAGEYKQMAIGE